jgi:hypothetical protein
MDQTRPVENATVNVHLRVPTEIHAALTHEARENDRKLNGEIVARLKASLKKEQA